MKRIWDIVRISDACSLALIWWALLALVAIGLAIWYWYRYKLSVWRMSFLFFCAFLVAIFTFLLAIPVSNYWWQYILICLTAVGVGVALPRFRSYLTDINKSVLSDNALLGFAAIVLSFAHATITVVSGGCGEVYYWLGYATVFLPNLLVLLQEAMGAIPNEKYKLWQYPSHKRREFIKSANMRDQTVRITLRIAPSERSNIIDIPTNAPVSMTMDDFLFIFFHDFNKRYPDRAVQLMATAAPNFGSNWRLRRGPRSRTGRDEIGRASCRERV